MSGEINGFVVGFGLAVIVVTCLYEQEFRLLRSLIDPALDQADRWKARYEEAVGDADWWKGDDGK